MTILLPPGPGADILFDRLTSDFGEIGVTLHRATGSADADLVLLDSVARTPRYDWYFDRLSCAALRGPCSADADQLVAQARAAPDAATAASLWAQAENALAASNVFIPLGPPIRWSLARPDMPGFAPNRWGLHPLMQLALKPAGG